MRDTTAAPFASARSTNVFAIFEPRKKLHAERMDNGRSPHKAAVLACVGVVLLSCEVSLVDVALPAARAVEDHGNGIGARIALHLCQRQLFKRNLQSVEWPRC